MGRRDARQLLCRRGVGEKLSSLGGLYERLRLVTSWWCCRLRAKKAISVTIPCIY